MDKVEKQTMRRIFVEPKYSFTETAQRQGQFLDLSSYDMVLDGDVEVYVPNHGEYVFLCRHQVCDNYILSSSSHQTLKQYAKQMASNNRGYAGGIVTPDGIGGKGKILEPNNVKTRVQYPDGRVSNYRKGNKVKSAIIGYFDKADITKQNRVPCRTTSFTQKYTQEWPDVVDVAQYVAKCYHQWSAQTYFYQLRWMRQTPHFQIQGTPFSTITVNYNWRTACHVDKGDLNGAYTMIYTTGNGWKGWELGFPRYGIAIRMRPGSVVMQNPHEHHCNCEGDGDRLSMVFYYRQGMSKCR